MVFLIILNLPDSTGGYRFRIFQSSRRSPQGALSAWTRRHLVSPITNYLEHNHTF